MDIRFRPRSVVPLALCAGLCLVAAGAGAADPPAGTPSARARAAGAARPMTVVGVAWNADNSVFPGARVRLRDVRTGRVAGVAVTNGAGRFTFTSIEGGTYLTELVSETGQILSVGHPFSVAPGETVATFVRLAARVPWFNGFFANAASAVASTAASAGVTALAPEARPCASPSPGCD